MARPARKTSSSSAKQAPAKRSASQTTEERAAHDAAKHAPVSLPSGGSFDRETLQKGLDRAVDKQPHNRQAEVDKALASARDDSVDTLTGAPNALPGHEPMRTETILSPGVEVGSGKTKRTEGEVRVEEIRQVYTGSDDDVATAGTSTSRGGQAVVGGKSEVVGMTPVDGSPAAAPAPVSVPPQTGESGEPGTTTDVDQAEQNASAAAASDA